MINSILKHFILTYGIVLELGDEIVGVPRSRSGTLRSECDYVTLETIVFKEPFKSPSSSVTASPLTELVEF